MDHTYWLKQTSEPLFPDILWSRPESKAGAGKLAVIGGNSHGFSAPGIAYMSALQAGAGVVQAMLPDAVKKVVKHMLPAAEFAPSTPSGSFNKRALDDLVRISSWADCTLLSGDIGRNSETAILLENFVEKFQDKLVITQDAVDYFKEIPLQLVNRDQTIVVLSLSQLQKMFINTPTIMPITLSMNTPQLVEALHNYTIEHQACIVTNHNDMVFVAHKGKVSTTKHEEKIWRVETAAKMSVWWLQNPDKLFEATTSSLYQTDK